MSASISIDVPEALAASYSKHSGASGRAWIAALPGLVADFLNHWALRLDGFTGHGMASLVLPVIRADGTLAALKLQPVSEETAAAPIGLRAWNGDGVVRLLDHDPDTGTMLLERLDATRPRAVPALRDLTEQRLVRTCASAMGELIGQPADRLLHWDLHYDSILAGQREPWLAIDPGPLAGDAG